MGNFVRSFGRVSVLAIVSGVSSASFASNVSLGQQLKDMNFAENYVYHAQRSPREMSGTQLFTFNAPGGLFCNNTTEITFTWNTVVKEAQIIVDNEGNTAFELIFGDSSLLSQGYVRDGLSCGWNGGELKTELSKIFVRFRLIPQNDSPYPKVAFDSLSFDGLAFSHISMGQRDGWKIQGQSPQWLDSWVQQNILTVLNAFLSSPLKQHLDNFLSAELERRLKEGEGVTDPLMAPNHSFRLAGADQ